MGEKYESIVKGLIYMVKRLKAMFLLMLLLGSARIAKAETQKGEAHVSNKTNIETQAPVEDTSLENDIIKTDEATKEEVIVAQEDQLTEEQVKNELNDLYKSLGKLSNNDFYLVSGMLGSYLLVNYDILPEDFKENPVDSKFLPKNIIGIMNWFTKKYKCEIDIEDLLRYADGFSGHCQMENAESLSMDEGLKRNPGDLCHDKELKALIDRLLEEYKEAYLDDIINGCQLGETYRKLYEDFKNTVDCIDDPMKKLFYISVGIQYVHELALTSTLSDNEEIRSMAESYCEDISSMYDFAESLRDEIILDIVGMENTNSL